MARRGVLLTTAPWRRAVTLLRHRPSVALAVAGASVVLGTSASAAPLFLSSSGNAALHRQLDAGCGATAAPTVTGETAFSQGHYFHRGHSYEISDPAGFWRARDTEVRAAFATVPQVGSARTTIVDNASLGDFIQLGSTAATARNAVRVVTRTDFAQHLTVVDDAGGSGVWLPDTLAHQLHVRAGAAVVLAKDGAVEPTRVRGVYADLRNRTLDGYWCSASSLLRPTDPWANTPVLPMVLSDRTPMIHAMTTLGLRATTTWEFPLPVATLTTASAAPVVRGVDAARSKLAYYFDVDERLGHDLRRAQLVESSLNSTLDPVAVGAIGVALIVVAAAGSFWAERRRTEVALLVARGVGPVPIAVKAALEMLPACVAGTLGGYVLARALVSTVGPLDLVTRAATTRALWWSLGAAFGGLLLIAAVAGARGRNVETRRIGHGPSRLARAPWELLPIGAVAVAVAAFTKGGVVQFGGDAATGVGSVARVDPRLLTFPLLGLVAAVSLVVRALAPGFHRMGRGGERLGPAAYLTGRRIAGTRSASLLMVAAAALPIGVSAYATAMTDSVRTTLHAKVLRFAGTDVVVGVPGHVAPPAPVAGNATLLVHVAASVDNSQVDVLGVDPATYLHGVERTSGLSGPLARLAAPHPQGAVPIIVAGLDTGPETTLSVLGPKGIVSVPAHVVAHVAHLPGARNNGLALVPRQDLERLTTLGCCELWIRGSEQATLRAVHASGIPVTRTARASDVLDASSFLPVTYTFQFLTALAILTGAVAVIGLVLYVESRTRARRVAFVLTRSMGLRSRSQFSAYVAEFVALLGVGGAIGAVLAVVAAGLAYRHLDVAPSLDPAPLLGTPVPTITALVGSSILVAVAVAAYAQWTSHRIRPAEVMRDAGA